MQTRMMRARGIAAGLLTALASFGALAQTPNTPSPETSLLGVRLLATYNDVLHKFGQPNEIQVGEPTVSGQGQLASAGGAAGGAGFPGMPGMMGGRGGMAGMPGMVGGRGGYPGMGGGGSSYPGGMPGMMRGGGGSSYPGMMSGGGGSSYPGMGAPGMIPGMGTKGGLPGMGGPGASGSSYPGMAGGYPGMGGNNNNNAVEDPGETTWWYHFPRQGLHYSFLFNKEGRVIQIQAYGQQPAPKIVAPRSVQGITLGSDLGQVIRKYGWSNDGEHAGDYVVMRYGKLDRIAFQTRHNKVLGIVLGRITPETPQPGMPGMMGGSGGPGSADGSGSTGTPAGGGGDE